MEVTIEIHGKAITKPKIDRTKEHEYIFRLKDKRKSNKINVKDKNKIVEDYEIEEL